MVLFLNIDILIRADAIHRVFRHQVIEPIFNQGRSRVFGAVDDQLFVNIDTGVDQDGNAGQVLETFENSIIERVVPFADDLRAGVYSKTCFTVSHRFILSQS